MGIRQTLTAKLASSQELSKAGWNRGQQDNQRRGTSFSYRPGGQQDQQLNEHIRALRQQISRLQQEVDELQASQGNRNQGNAQRSSLNNSSQGYYNDTQAGNTGGQRQGSAGSQQSYYNGRRPSMMDRTDLRSSNGRGFSRDHGPRETPSGNNANED